MKLKSQFPAAALAVLITLGSPVSSLAQNDFVPPPGTKKYKFFPHAGNFYGDLFPVNYVDVDTTAGIRDFRCGDQAYDGHNGIDTNILGFAAQAVGVPIYAALDGTVIFTRDGQPDMNTTRESPTPSNLVQIDHGNGHITSYFHLKKNSVAVSVGQFVKAGQQIGLTASSGNSLQPHLHFESQVGQKIFEPFAGDCRPGPSNFTVALPFRSEPYLREFVISGQDLSTWQGFPFDSARTGTFLLGMQRVSAWFLFANGESITSVSGRYLRPNGSVAFATPLFPISNAGRSVHFFFNPTFNLDATGTWHLEVSINGQVVTSAPFTVISSGPITNRAPGGVQVAFDPPAPKAEDVLFCRITSSTLFLDPDYALPRFRYLWRVNGTTVRDVISAGAADAIPRNTALPGDTVTCTVTPSDGALNGPSTNISVNVADPDLLLNISTRLRVGTGENALIGGFIITGTDPKNVILRAIGPSLADEGVTGFLVNPTLQLVDGNQQPIVFNDDWKTTQRAEIEATGVPPKKDEESAIVRTLAPGVYTAIVRGKDNGTGIGLVEVFDLSRDAPAKLANISSRGFVETNQNVMIGGFIVGGGTGGARVVARAIGPSLQAAGVQGALANPTLRLANAQGTTVRENDNWKDGDRAQLEALQIAPTHDLESAFVQTLAAGSYTAIVSGKDGGTGVGLVELYHVQ